MVRIRGEASPMLPWPTEPTVDQGGEAGDDASVHNSVGEAPAGLIALIAHSYREHALKNQNHSL